MPPSDERVAAYVVPAVGAAWRNRHTGEETMITRLDTRVERVPGDNGFRDEYEFVVHHTVNAPPGFSEGYGDDLSSFLSHWRPVDQSNNRLAEREVEAGTSMTAARTLPRWKAEAKA